MMKHGVRQPERAFVAPWPPAEEPRLSSVDRALSLLEKLLPARAVGATELANRTGCAKRRPLRRFAAHAGSSRFVVQNADRPTAWARDCLPVWRRAPHELRFTARRCRRGALRDAPVETVQLTVLEGSDVHLRRAGDVRRSPALGRTMDQRAPATRSRRVLAQLVPAVSTACALLLPARCRAHRRLDPELDDSPSSSSACARAARGQPRRLPHDVGGVVPPPSSTSTALRGLINICVPLFRLEELASTGSGRHPGAGRGEVRRASSPPRVRGAVGT